MGKITFTLPTTVCLLLRSSGSAKIKRGRIKYYPALFLFYIVLVKPSLPGFRWLKFYPVGPGRRYLPRSDQGCWRVLRLPLLPLPGTTQFGPGFSDLLPDW